MIRKFCFGFVIIFFSCSNENNLEFDTSLVYGKWYTRVKCQTENYKIYQEDGIYTHRYSFNEDCQSNQYNTYESTANYDIQGAEIYYEYVTTGEIIINGTNDLSVTSEVDYKFYRERIIDLTENEMTIEVEFQFNDSDVIENKIIELFKTPLL